MAKPARIWTGIWARGADIQAVTGWLAAHGFTEIEVGVGRTAIEFSGNAGQVRGAFHTEIHQFFVQNQTRFANYSDPQVPAALKLVIAGVVSLNNFPVQSHAHKLGAFQKSLATGETKPLFTFSGCYANCYALGPADFATIYNTQPLLSGSPTINGTGQASRSWVRAILMCRTSSIFAPCLACRRIFPPAM
jgi:subtilase family serine protease